MSHPASCAVNGDPSTLDGDERVDVERLRDARAVQAWKAELIKQTVARILEAHPVLKVAA